MNREKRYLWITLVLFGLLALVSGCGGGSDAGPSSKISMITGVISDGPIKNARVSLDLNFNGRYDDGEPFGITNEKGEYRIDYILQSGMEYPLIVEGSAALGTSDKLDNPGDGEKLTFSMAAAITSVGAPKSDPVAGAYRQDVSPVTFRTYLTQLEKRGVSVGALVEIINDKTSGSVALFQAIKANQSNVQDIVQTAAAVIASANTQQGTTAPTTGNPVSENLSAILKNGSQDQNFAGVGPYIETKVVYRGIDIFLGLNIATAVKEIIQTNFDRCLTSDAPVFSSGSGSFDGVTIDSAGKTIQIKVDGENSSTLVSWSFVANKIVRTSRKYVSGGIGNGSVYESTYTFSNSTQNLTNAVLTESGTEYSGGVRKLGVSYEGSAVYDRSTGALISANYYQRLTETNLLSLKSDTLDGLITMAGGTLAFSGSYSFNLRSYGAIGGGVKITNGSYSRGCSFQDGNYFNNNDLTNAVASFTATSTYTVPTANPAWLIGVWSGTFTDSGNPDHNGTISLLATATNATWWGQSFDKTRNYGTGVEVTGTTAITVRLLNDKSLWTAGSKISDTRIEGQWAYNSFKGSFVLTKTP